MATGYAIKMGVKLCCVLIIVIIMEKHNYYSRCSNMVVASRIAKKKSNFRLENICKRMTKKITWCRKILVTIFRNCDIAKV